MGAYQHVGIKNGYRGTNNEIYRKQIQNVKLLYAELKKLKLFQNFHHDV